MALGVIVLERFFQRGVAKASVVGYTVDNRMSKKMFRLLCNRARFYESYIVVYGLPTRRIYTKLRTIYLDPPYARGYIFLYGSILVQTPVALYTNLNSRCLDLKTIEHSIDYVSDGSHSIVLVTPFTNDRLTSLYRDRVYRILKEFGIGLELLYPSYSLVIGKNNIFRDSPYSLWGSEILASLMIELLAGKEIVKVINTKCVDKIPSILNGLERLYIEKLVKDVIQMFTEKGLMNETKAQNYLRELVTW